MADTSGKNKALATSRGPRRAPVGAFTDALLAADSDLAERIIGAFMASGRRRVDVITDLFQPAQYEVGERWYAGAIRVADEHRATAIIEKLGAQMPATPSSRPVRRGARCLLAALLGERHVVGLNFLTMVLQDDGWVVDRLSTPTSRDELLRATEELHPQVVGISAAHAATRTEIVSTIAALRRWKLVIIVGGPLFNRVPDLWRLVGADGHGPDARVTSALLRKYV